MDLLCSLGRPGRLNIDLEKRHIGRRAVGERPEEALALFLVSAGGGGHIASATAVLDCLLQGHTESGAASSSDELPYPLAVEMLNVSEVLKPAVGGVVEVDGNDMYNYLMQLGWYGTAAKWSSLGPSLIEWLPETIRKQFARVFEERAPVLVVSFVPFLNKPAREGLLEAYPDCPFVTVVTDFEHSAIHPWIESAAEEGAQNQYYVLGNEQLAAQGRDAGYPEAKLLCTSGMVVHPIFYQAVREREDQEWVAAASEEVEEADDERVALVYFGGQPPTRHARTIALRFLAAHPGWRVVVLCGRNQELLEDLHGLKAQAAEEDASPDALLARRCSAQGFLGPEALAASLAEAELVLGKPGPGAISEASVCGVPFVSERSGTMPQEEPVLRWLEASGRGLVVDNLESLPEDLLDRVAQCRQASRRALQRKELPAGVVVGALCSAQANGAPAAAAKSAFSAAVKDEADEAAEDGCKDVSDVASEPVAPSTSPARKDGCKGVSDIASEPLAPSTSPARNEHESVGGEAAGTAEGEVAADCGVDTPEDLGSKACGSAGGGGSGGASGSCGETSGKAGERRNVAVFEVTEFLRRRLLDVQQYAPSPRKPPSVHDHAPGESKACSEAEEQAAPRPPSDVPPPGG